MTDYSAYFPALATKVYGKSLVYLDNAATTQRPLAVTLLQKSLSETENANVYRAVHYLAEKSTQRIEEARESTRAFLGAESTKEIIFTSSDTASINLVAQSFCEAFLNEGDEVITTVCEHHSNLLPWQRACKLHKATLKVIEPQENGEFSLDNLRAALSDKTKLVAVSHASNVLGILNPIKEIAALAHSKGAVLLVDGAQGVPHCRVDVREMGVDFYAFSGHKMYAATGTGVLYGKRELLEKMPPFMLGGEMVDTVTKYDATFAEPPHKFEAGTPNINAIPTLVPAIETLEAMHRDNELEQIRDYLLEELPKIKGLKLYGVPRGTKDKLPVFSFTVEGIHHEDIALILDKQGVAVRSGLMCAEPLMTFYGVTGMVRASFAPYNTMQDAQDFIAALKKAVEMLG